MGGRKLNSRRALFFSSDLQLELWELLARDRLRLAGIFRSDWRDGLRCGSQGNDSRAAQDCWREEREERAGGGRK